MMALFTWHYLCVEVYAIAIAFTIRGLSILAARIFLHLQFLPKDQHIVIPDLPGHGGTDRIELPDDMYPVFVEKLHEVCLNNATV